MPKVQPLKPFTLLRAGDFKLADDKLKRSDHFLTEAHNVQTGMLTAEAQGDHAKSHLLMVHSQDHLMNAITFRDLAGEIVALYKTVIRKESVR